MGDGPFSCNGPSFSSCPAEQYSHAIALFFADLDVAASVSAVVYYNSTLLPGEFGPGDHFFIEYSDVPLAGAPAYSPDLSAHLDLHPSGRITLRYQSLPGPFGAFSGVD